MFCAFSNEKRTLSFNEYGKNIQMVSRIWLRQAWNKWLTHFVSLKSKSNNPSPTISMLILVLLKHQHWLTLMEDDEGEHNEMDNLFFLLNNAMLHIRQSSHIRPQ